MLECPKKTAWNSYKKKLLNKKQLKITLTTHRKLIIWYILNLQQNFNIFTIKLKYIKNKINKFLLNGISNNLLKINLFKSIKYSINNIQKNILFSNVIGRQNRWWKFICFPISVLNNNYYSYNNSYIYLDVLWKNLIITIVSKKLKKIGILNILPKLLNKDLIANMVKLIFYHIKKNLKRKEKNTIFKKYYFNIFLFKLMELKLINIYNVNNINNTIYIINDQISSKKSYKPKFFRNIKSKIIKNKLIVKKLIYNNQRKIKNKRNKKIKQLKVKDVNEIWRIKRTLRPYSHKLYGIKKQPKKYIYHINKSKLFFIDNLKSVINEGFAVKKKIDMLSWKNRKKFYKNTFTKNFINLFDKTIIEKRNKAFKKKLHKNFFLTSLGLNFVTNHFHNKYMTLLLAQAEQKTIFKNNVTEFDVILINNQMNNIFGYLYLKVINNLQTAVWNYWSTYFLQKSIVAIYSRQSFYIISDRKRFSPLRGYRNKIKLVCWKKGQSWINKILLKRRLYSIRHWSIWNQRFPRRRLYKKYRNIKLPNKFYNNKFYVNLWNTNYNIRSCKRILYRWRYRRNLVLKSLRFFYSQLSNRALSKLLIIVSRRVSIYNNRYDQFFNKLDNQLSNQAYNFGIAQTSFWSNQFVKNGWLTVSNPNKDTMFLEYLFKIKKFLFPINLFDPKNLYWAKWEKTYKFEQYKHLLMPQRKNNFLITAGDLLNFIYSSGTFNSKFNNGNFLRYELPINKNILNGEIYEYSIDQKYKTPSLVQRELYNSAVLLFNPRIQDLSLNNRINAEKILFSIRNIK